MIGVINFLHKNKIVSYGTSLIGLSHIAKGSVCQDANKVCSLKNGWFVAAVADGVGSAKYSDEASKIAVETIINECLNNIDKNTLLADCKTVLLNAYNEANKRIQEYADNKKESISEFDTTLHSVIYDGQHLVYAHSGDGGIVALGDDGKYIKLTNPQKAEDGICVIPLRAGENFWEIKVVDDMIINSVLLATDGIYDTFFPYLLKGQENEIYVSLIRYFMDNNILNVSDRNIKDIENSRISFLQSDAYSSVSDDKTLVVLINSKEKSSFQPDEYYNEPDWNYLQEEWNKKAYPHLYKTDNVNGNAKDGEKQ